MIEQNIENYYSRNNDGVELPCNKEVVDLMYCGDDMVCCKDKVEDGVLGLGGSIYCIPLRAKSFVKSDIRSINPRHCSKIGRSEF